MNVDVLNQWHAALDNLGIIPSTIRKLSFFFYSLGNFNFTHHSFEKESKNYKNNNCKGKDFDNVLIMIHFSNYIPIDVIVA